VCVLQGDEQAFVVVPLALDKHTLLLMASPSSMDAIQSYLNIAPGFVQDGILSPQ
jgi:hypothetical protein